MCLLILTFAVPFVYQTKRREDGTGYTSVCYKYHYQWFSSDSAVASDEGNNSHGRCSFTLRFFGKFWYFIILKIFFGKFWYFIVLKIFWHLSFFAFDFFLIFWLDFFCTKELSYIVAFFGIWVWCMHVYFWRRQNQLWFLLFVSEIFFFISDFSKLNFLHNTIFFHLWIIFYSNIVCIKEQCLDFDF